jgi:hypothetical protein
MFLSRLKTSRLPGHRSEQKDAMHQWDPEKTSNVGIDARSKWRLGFQNFCLPVHLSLVAHSRTPFREPSKPDSFRDSQATP